MNRDRLPIPTPTVDRELAVDIRDQDPPFEAQEQLRPPAGAPNVLVIMLDDMGFGAPSAYGGPCRMPAADRLAARGLRYSRFHTTALCSPTRAALMTGRNHHAVGMGSVPDHATAAPGYTGIRPDSAATLARVLSGNGYATGAFGKMHQTPHWEMTAAGPFDRWPTHEGFDRFYGFLGGETNQFYPALIDGTTFIDPPATPEEGYHLSEDIVDETAAWIREVGTFGPDKPWFAYLSFGATHQPFHVPDEWLGRYRGEFDHGWDRQRERTLTQQKQMGLVPDGADLAPWTPGIPAWDDLSDQQRQVAARLMEVYAEFAEHTDFQVGRLLDDLEARGELDNTLIFYMLGDNGASAEGGFNGTLNGRQVHNAIPDDAERILGRLDELGSPSTYPHYPAGWAVAMNTPYQWTKQVASHYGGTRNGLIVSWPDRIGALGEIRHQWHHVVDVFPTILEAAGIPAPSMVDGVEQMDLHGSSMLASFTDGDAPEVRDTQYFETLGNRGIYHRGWTAVTKHRTPWNVGKQAMPAFAEDAWELYDTTTDWTQARDVAAKYPEKLTELRSLFDEEARRHHVYPLDDRLAERLDPVAAGRPSPMAGRRSIVLGARAYNVPEDALPGLKNCSHHVEAIVDVPEAGASGVIVSQGGRFAGWSLYVLEGVPTYCYNFFARDWTYLRGTVPLTPGRHTLTYSFTYDGDGLGKGGIGRLFVDDAEVAVSRIAATVPFKFSGDESTTVGRDRGTAVSPEYLDRGHFPFTGTIDSVKLSAAGDQVMPPARDRLEVEVMHQ